MIVSVMYQVGPGQKFDIDYYLKTHMPLVASRFTPMGMKGAHVLRGASTPSGEPPVNSVIALLEFDSADAFTAAAQAHGTEIFGDIPNFTDTQPSVQFNDQLL